MKNTLTYGNSHGVAYSRYSCFFFFSIPVLFPAFSLHFLKAQPQIYRNFHSRPFHDLFHVGDGDIL